MERIDLRIYETKNRRAPFSEWLERLRDIRGKGVIRTRIIRLRLGNFGDCKNVGSGVCELRIDFGSGYRIYFGRQGSEIVILLCGGDKRSQGKDIERAKLYWKDYLEKKDG